MSALVRIEEKDFTIVWSEPQECRSSYGDEIYWWSVKKHFYPNWTINTSEQRVDLTSKILDCFAFFDTFSDKCWLNIFIVNIMRSIYDYSNKRGFIWCFQVIFASGTGTWYTFAIRSSLGPRRSTDRKPFTPKDYSIALIMTVNETQGDIRIKKPCLITSVSLLWKLIKHR